MLALRQPTEFHIAENLENLHFHLERYDPISPIGRVTSCLGSTGNLPWNPLGDLKRVE